MTCPVHLRWMALASTCLLALSAAGQEQLVRNDSLENNSEGFIIGEFTVGEQAAARLTAPCDGSIVEVQILWLAGEPNDPNLLLPVIQQAIHIYDGSSFPEPGPELEILESPVLRPGFMNQFRYIDEGNQIPLDVPVTKDQRFYVSLEFAEPTRVRDGGPSVVRDADGCQNGRNAIYVDPGFWLNFCSFTTGDWVIRAKVRCGAGTGACCLPDGTCAVRTASQCTSSNGTYQGNGVKCEDVQCPTTKGACCVSNGNCISVPEADCKTLNGTWMGAGVPCDGSRCPNGACCLPDGQCRVLNPLDCANLSGTYRGNNVPCDPNLCPPPTGACCLSNDGCIIVTQTDCGLVGGAWAGPLTDCDDGNQNGKADDCEQPLRLGDLNCDGQITFSDINPFVLALSDRGTYEQRYPQCNYWNADCNRDGQVTFSDINPFVLLLAKAGPE